MLIDKEYYKEEKRHLSHRLVVLIGVTLFSFVLVDYIDIDGVDTIPYLLSFVSLVSIVHFFLILYSASTFEVYRKIFLIFIDISLLTYMIFILNRYGLFIFPMYIIIVIQSGIIFGIRYFYASIIFASIGLSLLLTYSSYWQLHYDIVITFGMTTLIIPLLYLQNIILLYAQRDKLSQELNATESRSNYDILTGVGNRKMYKSKILEATKKPEAFALLFIDLNKFKSINDTYGHHIGDEVLKEVTRRLKRYMMGDDFIARLGGDEFVIITRRYDMFLIKFLEDIEKFVIGEYEIERDVVNIELSIGVSLYPEDTLLETNMSKYADKAMYKAKSSIDKHYIFYRDIKDK